MKTLSVSRRVTVSEIGNDRAVVFLGNELRRIFCDGFILSTIVAWLVTFVTAMEIRVRNDMIINRRPIYEVRRLVSWKL